MPRPISSRPWVIGVLGGAITWISVFLVAGALLGVIRPLGQSARQWAGVLILFCVTFVMAVGLARWVGPKGMLAAGIAGVTHSLLLLSMILTAADGDSFNPLIFGWAGLSANALLAVAGGWLGQTWWKHAGVKPGSRLRPEIRLGMNAILMWVAFEFVIRLFGGIGLSGLVGSRVGGDMLAMAILLPSAAMWITKYASGLGVTQADLGYRRDRQAVAAGLLGGAGLLGAVYLTAPIDAWLFASTTPGAGEPALGVEAAWVAGLLLLVNGIIVPVLEERVWRGVIHTSLVRAWGTGIGLTVTALAFSLKHAIIDGSPGRLIMLFVFGLIVGVIRTRWGTTASTLAHCVTNLVATSILVAPVLRTL